MKIQASSALSPGGVSYDVLGDKIIAFILDKYNKEGDITEFENSSHSHYTPGFSHIPESRGSSSYYIAVTLTFDKEFGSQSDAMIWAQKKSDQILEDVNSSKLHSAKFERIGKLKITEVT